MSADSTIHDELIEVCRRMYAKGFVAATDGNVSARLHDGTILCTPTGRNKGDLQREDLIRIRIDSTVVAGSSRPSTEIQMHLQYYRERPDINAVVHAHAPYSTGFATTGEGLTGCVLPEIVVSLGAIPLARYATPSTAEVPASLMPYVGTHDVVLLQNHGVVAAGASLMNAYYTLEKTEHAAHILFIARMLGGERRLTGEQVHQLKSIAESSYGIDIRTKPACETANCRTEEGFEESVKTNLEISSHIQRAINELGL